MLERFDYLDRKRATAYLDICISSIHRLIEEKNLSIHYFEGDTDIWFAREELDRLKQKWQKHMTWSQVIQRLGVSLTTVQGLAEAGLVRIVPVEEGIKEQKIYIDEDSVETLIQKLQEYTVIQADVSQTGVLLRDVCVRHGSLKMNTAQVFDRVLAGKLLAYHPHETIFPLRAMWFVSEDVDGLAETVKDEQNWFTKSEVKDYLGVGWPVVTHLIAAGFLHSEVNIGPKQFFRRADVQAISQRWIFGGETARLLEVPGSCIAQLVHKGALQTASKPTAKGIGCYIFDRAYFMAWHQEHIMTPEMRKLTPNLKALQRRLKTQGIEPIAKFPNVYSRKEVLAVINP